jgi:integrase
VQPKGSWKNRNYGFPQLKELHMPKLNGRVPKYSLHKASGRAIVTLSGTDHYLGEYDSPESKVAYDRVIAEWLANGRRHQQPMPLAGSPSNTINELIAAYWEYAQSYYRKPDGTPTQEIETLRQALKPFILLYGETKISDFGPLALKAVREAMILKKWCRTHINKQISRLKSMFRWGTEQEIVAGGVFHALLAIKGLKQGRTEAVESEPVRPVPEELVDAIQPYVSRQVWSMIRLMLLTGARPGEIVNLRVRDIQRTGDVWKCELTEHKTAHHGHSRTIYLGPQGQVVVAPYVNRPADHFLFSPKEAEKDRRAKLTLARKTRASYGNVPGTNRSPHPKHEPGHHYFVGSFRRAIERGCDLAFPLPPELAKIKVKGERKSRLESQAEWKARLGTAWERAREWQRQHRWHPHQLRHNAATRIRKERGLDAARAILGHRSLAITEVYAEIDQGLAAETIRQLG